MREAFATTALVVALVGLAGCAGLSADPARYTGRTDKDPIPVAAVREEPSRPPDYELLGEVTARCRADDGVVVLDHEALADVDCSDALLEAALKEKAASVGGAVLTGLRCEVTEQSKGDRLASELHRCSARVASPRSADGSVPRPLAMAGDSYASPAQAFRVQVSLRPAEPGAAPRHARPADRVAELAAGPCRPRGYRRALRG